MLPQKTLGGCQSSPGTSQIFFQLEDALLIFFPFPEGFSVEITGSPGWLIRDGFGFAESCGCMFCLASLARDAAPMGYVWLSQNDLHLIGNTTTCIWIIYVHVYDHAYITNNRVIMCIYRLYMYLSMNRKKHRFLWKLHGVPLNLTPSPSPLPGDCKCDIHHGWYMWICWKRGGTFPKFNSHTPFFEFCCVLFFWLGFLGWAKMRANIICIFRMSVRFESWKLLEWRLTFFHMNYRPEEGSLLEAIVPIKLWVL